MLRGCLVVVMALASWIAVDAKPQYTTDQCGKIMYDDWYSGKYPFCDLHVDDVNCFKNGLYPRADNPGPRKECRTLASDEWRRLASGMSRLKTTRSPSGGLTLWQLILTYHRSTMSPGAHFGCGFLPWHRQFLAFVEQILQSFDPSVNLCYFDASLNSGMPDACHSVIFSDQFCGNPYGPVTSGPWANQPVYPGDCGQQLLNRDCGGNNLVPTPASIANLVSAQTYTQFVSPYTNSQVEAMHGTIHVFIGGNMASLSCAANDPMFYFHHGNMDRVWQVYRTTSQRTNVETEYPNDPNVPQFHRQNDVMRPFGLTCLQGMSRSHDPVYAPTPSGCRTHSDCGGQRALWCNAGRCMSAAGPGGTLGQGWPNEACCCGFDRNGRNVNNRCQC